MGVAEQEAAAQRLEPEIAEACGMLNVATARLVGLVAQVIDTEAWQVAGIHSVEQWVAWKCGVSPSRAHSLVRTARRLAEFPETRAAFEAGELCEDQVAVIAHRAPATIDAEVAGLARAAAVSQLRRVLSKYSFADQRAVPSDEAPAEEPRRVSFGCDDSGVWRLSAVLPADEGAVVEKALTEAREGLFRAHARPEPTRARATCRGPTPWWPWPSSHWPPRPWPAPIATATWSCCTSAPTGRATCISAQACPRGCAAS